MHADGDVVPLFVCGCVSQKGEGGHYDSWPLFLFCLSKTGDLNKVGSPRRLPTSTVPTTGRVIICWFCHPKVGSGFG